MLQLSALIRDTFRELLVRKVLIGFLIVNALGLIGLYFYVGSDSANAFADRLKIPMTEEFRAQYAGIIEVGVAAFFEVLLIFVSIFATASVVPAMLEKGTIDIYLSKPLSRQKLLAGKVLGSVSVVGSNIAVFMLAAWVILSIKLGVWNVGFLYAGAMMLFSFTILYSIVVLFNIIMRGSAVGIIVVYAHVMIISGVLAKRANIGIIKDSAVGKGIADVLYYALPQTSEHMGISGMLIMHGDVVSWTPLWASAIIGTVLYATAGWLFSRKEF